ncbi:hypothetical protein YC2023_104955 [Brassica napus]
MDMESGQATESASNLGDVPKIPLGVMLGVFKAPKTNVFEQKQNTERPQTVAPTSRSKLRERPRCVAARGRSGLVLASPGGEFASDFLLSLWDVAPSFGSDFSTSLWKVAPSLFSRLPVMKTRATLLCRSG